MTDQTPISKGTPGVHNARQMHGQDFRLTGRKSPMAIRQELSDVFAGFTANDSVTVTHEAVPRELTGMRTVTTTALLLVNRVRIDRLPGHTDATPTEDEEKNCDADGPASLKVSGNQIQIEASFQTTGGIRPAPQSNGIRPPAP